MPIWSNPGHDGRVDYAEISGVQGASGEGAGGARPDRGDDRDPALTSQCRDLSHQRGGAEPLRIEPTVAADLPRRADYPLHNPRREVSLPDVATSGLSPTQPSAGSFSTRCPRLRRFSKRISSNRFSDKTRSNGRTVAPVFQFNASSCRISSSERKSRRYFPPV